MPAIYSTRIRSPLAKRTAGQGSHIGMGSTREAVDLGHDADAAAEDFLRNRRLMFHIATQWYHLPRAEAEPLVQEIAITYLKKRAQVRKLRPWLIGAMIQSCRLYWKKRRRTEPLPDDIAEWPDPKQERFEDEVVEREAVARALALIPKRCREALREKFLRDQTLREIARIRKTTEKYAKTLVYTCLKELRMLYVRITQVAA